MKVLIVGAGKLGHRLAQHMISEDMEVVLMDLDPRVLERISDHLDVLTIVGNGIDIQLLRQIHIGDFDLLIASTDRDETNSLICAMAKKLAPIKTIARIREPGFIGDMDFLKEEMGIDFIVNPDLASAKTMEKYLLNKLDFHLDEFASGKVQMLDYHIEQNKDFIGKSLRQLEGFDSLLISAISRKGQIIIPHGSTRLRNNDIIYIIGEKKDIEALARRYKLGTRNKRLDHVMILGGSNIGYYLAQALTKAGIHVKIIEVDKKRAQDLSNSLDGGLVIHGDGTDINLLEEEMLDQMDTFVGVTGFDEANILMAIMAKQAGVARTIAKISRQNYNKIIDRLDVDHAIDPVSITAGNILKFIRGGRVETISLLIDGDAEITEILVGQDSPLIGIPLSNLNLPRGIIIGAIVRKDQVLIPKGRDKILPGDRIVVFCIREEVAFLRKFYRPEKGGKLGELWNNIKGSRNYFNN